MKDSYFWSLEMIGGEKIDETNFMYITGMFFLWSNATYPSHCV